jgi:hypothetical protein
MIRPLRRSVFFCALLCLLATLVFFPLARRAAMQETTSCVQVPSGVVNWYPADVSTAEEGNAVDIVSHNNGTLQNGATFAPGKVGTAFSLDGVDDNIEVPHRASLQLNTLTIDAWINRTSTADARIVDKMTAGGEDGYALDIVNNHLRLIIGDASVVGTTTLTTGTYVHVAGTFDGADLRVYVNGTLDGTTNVGSATTPTNALPLHIGSDSTGSGSLFAGQIDEVELFNRALSQGDIQSLVDADSTGKCRAAAGGQFIITEFRFRGPGTQPVGAVRASVRKGARASASGGGKSKPSYAADPNGYDEFIELYNNTDSDINVATSDGSAGWALATESNNVVVGATRPSAVSQTALIITFIPNGTLIPARAHYLVANTDGYSLGDYPAGPETTATPDLPYDTFDIPDDGGVALFNTADETHFSETTRLDAVGFAPPVVIVPELHATSKKLRPSVVSTLFREGDGLSNPVVTDVEHSFVRKMTTGIPQDTDNNAADFQLVATDPVQLSGAVLGAPGPENLSSPLLGLITSSLIETCAGRDDPPNRVRDASDSVAQFGSLTLRRRFTNFSEQPMTRLRFRVVDITTQPAEQGTADFRVLSSSTTTVQVLGANCTGSADLTVQGLTLEQPPSQPSGGGLNSTLSAGTITLTAPLEAGASIDVQFLLGVEQTGHFRIFVILEESFATSTTVVAAPTHAKQKVVTGDHSDTPGATTKGRGGAKSLITPRIRN